MTEQKPQASLPPQRPRAAPGVRGSTPTVPVHVASPAEDDTPTGLIPAVAADLPAAGRGSVGAAPAGSNVAGSTPAGSNPAGSNTDNEDTVIGPAIPAAPLNGSASSPPRPRGRSVNGSAAHKPEPRAQGAVPTPAPAATSAPATAPAPASVPAGEPGGSRDDEVGLAEKAGLSERLKRTARKRAASPAAPLAGSDTVTEPSPSTDPEARRRSDPPTAATITSDVETTAPMAATAVTPRGQDREAPSTPAAPKARPKAVAKTRKAHLRLVRVDPWSVTKIAFALSLALAIVTVVAITIVWTVLGAAGVWDAINSSVATVMSDNADSFDITKYVGFERVIGLTIVVAAADVLLITALAPVAAFLYNLASSLLGGLEVTLAEDH